LERGIENNVAVADEGDAVDEVQGAFSLGPAREVADALELDEGLCRCRNGFSGLVLDGVWLLVLLRIDDSCPPSKTVTIAALLLPSSRRRR
jgi:hypothetical protein